MSLSRECLSEGADLILAAGGDGTINEVANGMVGSHVPLAILPAGTANVLATETRLGGNAIRVAHQLDQLKPARIALGLLAEPDGTPRRHFLAMAGAGLDAHIVVNLNPRTKELLGKGAYWLASFRSTTRRLQELHASSEGSTIRCSLALASRVRNYGGDLEIAAGASILQEHLELVLFEGENPLRYLKYLLGVATGKLYGMTGITVIKTRSLTLQAAGSPVHVQLDGEDCGTLPARVELIPDALTLLLPPEFLERERRRWTT